MAVVLPKYPNKNQILRLSTAQQRASGRGKEKLSEGTRLKLELEEEMEALHWCGEICSLLAGVWQNLRASGVFWH